MKSVLLNTTVIGSSVKLPRHPRLILGEPGKYVHGDILDANAVTSEVDSKIAALINSAPSALDTLKEIADALGNDENLANTLLNKIDQLDAKINAHSENQGATNNELDSAIAVLDNRTTSVENRLAVLEETLSWCEE